MWSTPVAQGGAEATPDDRLLADRYRLVRVIGSGGMGVVWESVHAATGRRVAVKLLRAPGEASGRETLPVDVAGRFLREARATARVRHPHVVEVLDVGRDPERGALFIVYELLEGETLRALLDRRGRLSPEEAAELLLPVLEGLAAAHREAVLHRDLKPENVMLAREPDGRVVPRLIDFGIARFDDPELEAVTRTGAALGTAHYMSPEQARGARDLDARSDVWAAGVLWFEALTGARPYEGDGYNEVLAKILTEAPPRLAALCPEAPRALAAAIDRALARDRESRFATVDELIAALQTALGARAPRPASRAIGLAACAAALAVGLTFAATRVARHAPAAPSRPTAPGSLRAPSPAAPRGSSATLGDEVVAARAEPPPQVSAPAPALAPAASELRARHPAASPRSAGARGPGAARPVAPRPPPVNGALVLDP